METSQLEFAAQIITIIGLPLAILSVMVGIYELRQNKKVQESQFWLELRREFRVYDTIHRKLRQHDKYFVPNQDEWPEVDAYLGQFELCFTMLKNKLISKDIFISQYDYRIQNILLNRAIKKKVLAEQEYWSLFISLCMVMGYSLD